MEHIIKIHKYGVNGTNTRRNLSIYLKSKDKLTKSEWFIRLGATMLQMNRSDLILYG